MVGRKKSTSHLCSPGMLRRGVNLTDFVLCSNCFSDQGLKLDAERIGEENDSTCPNCKQATGRKLTRDKVNTLAYSFFVVGTFNKLKYGGAPIVQFNEHQETDISTSQWFEKDLELISSTLGVGFFYYGPPLWMVGEVEPLVRLQEKQTQMEIIQRIIEEYPPIEFEENCLFYRLRKEPKDPVDPREYDSPPTKYLGKGRLDSIDLPVMYSSPDLEVCLHELRVAAEDELYVASLVPKTKLKLLDISFVLPPENVTTFESLDMAVHMLFLSGEYSYPISREISKAARIAGFDGLVYSSYFSCLRTGTRPFETAFGLSYRNFPQMRKYEQAKLIPNFALFGYPIADGKVTVRCINKLILSRVKYEFSFGPVGVEPRT